jgi:hypothetical protein
VTDQELLHIYVEVASGRGNHGSFLTSFATTVAYADPENFILLRSAARTLVDKYRLADYLDNYQHEVTP